MTHSYSSVFCCANRDNAFISVLTKENRIQFQLPNKWKRRGYNQTFRLLIECREPGRLWRYNRCPSLKWSCNQMLQKWCLQACTSRKNFRFQSTKLANMMTLSKFQVTASLAALWRSRHRMMSASLSVTSAGTSLRSPNSGFYTLTT